MASFVPDEPTTLLVDDVRLELQRWTGGGVPILLLHEGLGSVSMWRDFPQRLALATGHSVLAWSRRGYGQSDPLPGRREPDYMHREADAVPRLMDELAIERAVLFGHSDGASIALIAAARLPDRVAALILEAPHVFLEELSIASIARTKQLYSTTSLGQLLGRHHRDPDAVFWAWNDIWLDPRFRDWSIEELLPAIRAPALLIQGRDDEYGTLAQLDRIAAALPGIERLELEHCGHAPHRDQPEAVLAAAAAFLQRIGRGTL
jgi:pimeloyl-ACP methyl ester carboxylesterase